MTDLLILIAVAAAAAAVGIWAGIVLVARPLGRRLDRDDGSTALEDANEGSDAAG